MRRAAQEAGIFNSNEQSTFFALEPEAAACDYVVNNPNSCAIAPGSIYIICDIGGGTVDISTHKRVKENNNIYIEEVYPPIGGNNGSTFINKKFLDEVITKLFGKNTVNQLLNLIKDPSSKKDIYFEYCEFLESIEEFKINISEKRKEKNEAKRINCSIFSDFIDKNISIEDLIENFNENCKEEWKITKYNEFKIYFPYQIMIDMTKEIIVNKIVKYLNNIISNVPNVNSIIYAGSVSSNPFIISMIQEELGYNINHYLCTYPALAVVKGAVIFGLNPYMIKTRISKYTIGIACNEIWDEFKYGLHPEKKYFDSEDNCFRCRDVFSPIIEKDQKIPVDKINSRNYKIKGSKSTISFYKTTFYNITFVDEKYNLFKYKCQKFGELTLDVGKKFDKNNRDLIIQLKLGGTFISVDIIYKNEIVKANFDFTKEN